MPWALEDAAGTTTYALNMIDTPGHVDFTYEVSRSLAACEGAVLLVDAAQGIEAQTLANLYLAMENELTIIPVLNKIDLPAAQPEKYAEELAKLIGGEPEDCLRVSGKTGEGVEPLLDTIVAQIPRPTGDADAPARAMIFDSVYDTYRGVVTYVRVVDGNLNPREKIVMMSTRATHELLEIGVISPSPSRPRASASARSATSSPASRTCASRASATPSPTRASRPPRTSAATATPSRWSSPASIPIDGSDYPALRDALDKLKLNDAALVYEPETSAALGFGFRCGFLGPAAPRDRPRAARARVRPRPHLDPAQRRLRRHARRRQGRARHEPERVPRRQDPRGQRADRARHDARSERVRRHDHGAVPAEARHPARHGLPLRGPRRDALHPAARRDRLRLLRPAEVDAPGATPRSTTSPTATRWPTSSRSRSSCRARPSTPSRAIVHKDKAYAYGVMMAGKLKELIPRQQFEVPIQAAIGSRIIARENIRAIRKDVLAKCYGGDISRKRKLLEKQKEGKKRMKMVGRVEVPQEAFVAALSQRRRQGQEDLVARVAWWGDLPARAADHHEHEPSPRFARLVERAVGYRIAGYPARRPRRYAVRHGDARRAPRRAADHRRRRERPHGIRLGAGRAVDGARAHPPRRQPARRAARPAPGRSPRALRGAGGRGRRHVARARRRHGSRCDELRDRLHETDSWARRFALVEGALLELERDGGAHRDPAPEVTEAWRLIRASGGAAPIRDVASRVGWSMRRLQTQFAAEYGVTPKALARVRRFERSLPLVAAGELSLADVATGCGWSDHAHMDRDWRELAGTSPTRWRTDDVLSAPEALTPPTPAGPPHRRPTHPRSMYARGPSHAPYIDRRWFAFVQDVEPSFGCQSQGMETDLDRRHRPAPTTTSGSGSATTTRWRPGRGCASSASTTASSCRMTPAPSSTARCCGPRAVGSW